MANIPKAPHRFQKFQKIPLLFSIVFLAFSTYAFVFLYKKINTNKELSQRMQTEWQAESAKRNQLTTQDLLLKFLDTERTLLESHFTKSSNVVPFLDNVEKMATAVRAESEVVSVDISKDKTTLSIELKATGSFGAIYKFLTLLENSQYELDFSSVDIQRTNVGESITEEGKTPKAAAPVWGANIRMKLLSFVP